MIKNAKLVGSQIDPSSYHRRDPEVKRGNPAYIMSNSELTEFARNPHRWRAGYREGDMEDTEATAWGNLIDVLVLDPERYGDKFVVAPEVYPCEPTKKDSRTEKPWTWNANYCKEWRDEQGDKTIIKTSKLEDSDRAIKALATDSIISEVLECSKKQVMVTAEWHDKPTGLIVPLKILIDLVPDIKHELFGQFLGDLKTCRDASQRGFKMAIFQRGYHNQGALYLDVYEAATGENRTDFIFPIQENFDPFEPARRMLSTEYIQIGRDNYRLAIAKYCQCLATLNWPGYDDEIGRASCRERV